MRLAVVGAGRMGALHARAVSDCDVTELTAIVDPIEERAIELADRHRVHHSGDVAPVLDDVDGCVIAVPDRLHVDVTLKVLAAEKHVFLEKPMAHTLEAAQSIEQALERSSARLAVAHILRHDPRFAGARDAVATGSIGEVLHVRASRLVRSHVGEQNNGQSPIWMYQGVHDVDLIQWIGGHRITSVYGRTVSKLLESRGFRGADAAFVTFDLANGAIGSLNLSWAMPATSPAGLIGELEVVGTEGALTIDIHGGGLSLITRDGQKRPDTVHWPTFNSKVGGALVQELRDFVSAIRTGNDFVMPLDDAMAAVAAVEAIGHSIKVRGPTDVVAV